jgi:hypothetical protein
MQVPVFAFSFCPVSLEALRRADLPSKDSSHLCISVIVSEINTELGQAKRPNTSRLKTNDNLEKNISSVHHVTCRHT